MVPLIDAEKGAPELLCNGILVVDRCGFQNRIHFVVRASSYNMKYQEEET